MPWVGARAGTDAGRSWYTRMVRQWSCWPDQEGLNVPPWSQPAREDRAQIALALARRGPPSRRACHAPGGWHFPGRHTAREVLGANTGDFRTGSHAG